MLRWLRYLGNPRVWIPMVLVALLVAVVAVVGFLTDNWLPIVIAILAIALVVLVVLLVRMLLRSERDERLESGLGDDSELELAEKRAAESASGADVRSRFREALAEIRRTIGVYEVPWFLVVGGADSGKTSLLEASGLHLPAEYARSRVFGPTQTCDFFLFNEAIAVDTAGRYAAGATEVDRDEWQLLLGQLRRGRSDLPVNGVVFAISAPSLFTLGAAELEEQARQFRRRLNEIEVVLGVEAPIYILLTKADQIEGFTEFMAGLPPERQPEAIGWTCDQRRLADPAERIVQAFGQIRARLDGMLHELLMREPDATNKRRMFVFPQEVEELGRAVARFVGSAFKRDIYTATPFLRGVYLVSSGPEGEAASPTLQRLGQGWARSVHSAPGGTPRGLHDLFAEVLVGDDELALPKSRLGPRARRVLLGAGGAVALGALVMWGFSFVQNYRGTHALERAAELALSSDPTIQQVSRLREEIERGELQSRSTVNRLGFGFLDRAVAHAKRTFVWSFEQNFDRFTRANLEQALRQRGDLVFRAAVVLATDLEFLASSADSAAPDLKSHLPRRVKDPVGYGEAYASFVRWMRPSDREELSRRMSEVLARSAAGLIAIGPLEDQTRRVGGRFGPVCYQEAGLPTPDTSAGGCIPGIYTSAGYDGLFERLVAAVEDTGALPKRRIEETKRRYVERFDRGWRRYLLEVPTEPRADPAVRTSPHLKVLEQIHGHTSADLARDEPAPGWIGMVADVRRNQAAEGEVAPWNAYMAALENVALDVEDAVADPAQALLVAHEVADGQTSSFGEALEVVRRIVPRSGDASARGKLREIMEAPILDGFSAVLESARRELDGRWNGRVVQRYGGQLTATEFESLYGPRGALDSFRAEELELFLRDGSPAGLLEGRGMDFGPDFLAWMDRASTLQRTLFASGGSSIAVRLRGVPSSLSGAHGLRVKRRDLRLICPDEQQNFVYREGSGAHTFRWTSACQSLVLRILVGGEGARDRELVREWKGPQALPGFLQEGEALGGGEVQWTIDGPEGIRVKAKYRIESGGEIRSIVHRSPPASMGS